MIFRGIYVNYKLENNYKVLVLLYYKRKGNYGVVIKSGIESIILKPP